MLQGCWPYLATPGCGTALQVKGCMPCPGACLHGTALQVLQIGHVVELAILSCPSLLSAISLSCLPMHRPDSPEDEGPMAKTDAAGVDVMITQASSDAKKIPGGDAQPDPPKLNKHARFSMMRK